MREGEREGGREGREGESGFRNPLTILVQTEELLPARGRVEGNMVEV